MPLKFKDISINMQQHHKDNYYILILLLRTLAKMFLYYAYSNYSKLQGFII